MSKGATCCPISNSLSFGYRMRLLISRESSELSKAGKSSLDSGYQSSFVSYIYCTRSVTHHSISSAASPSSGRCVMTSSTIEISWSMSGRSAGSTVRHFRTTCLTGSDIVSSLFLLLASMSDTRCLPRLASAAPSSGNLQSPPSTQSDRDPPVSSLRASKGDLPTKHAYNVQPKLQMSTFVSMTVPVLTSKSSGAR